MGDESTSISCPLYSMNSFKFWFRLYRLLSFCHLLRSSGPLPDFAPARLPPRHSVISRSR